jgi:CheY-like chemotaxis protein
LQDLNQSLEQHVQERTEALREANHQLTVTVIALEKALHVKDEFLASMSHELRTPLTGILGFSEAMQAGTYGGLNDKQIKVLASIQSSGHHLLALINDILDLSKIEADKLDIQIAPCSLAEICRASLELVKGLAHKKQQNVEYSPPAMPILVNADMRRVKQIVVNLLGNAIKFTPQKGKLGLMVEADEANQQVHIIVWDKGIGIKPEHMPKLFQPFTQIDSSLAREYSGSGLGLSLVQRLAQLQGGSVKVESVFGEGSRFIVTLPWFPQADPSIAPDSRQHSRDPHITAENIPAGLILIVDDNPQVLELVTDFLEARNYRTVQAHSGMEALENIGRIKPDFVLMDIQMPGMDGLEAIHRIRNHADPAIAATRIIAVTALAMPNDRERCLSAGADEYLSKPFALEELLTVFQNMLPNK